ncbi:hypothetical protein [Pedobacter sp. Hv1]|uniref:hypothetical protein n=1 Tax=Pedobacter sp. Hv1 TaxID=1740090 RepID=UPI0006D8C455|nr:hypothetical protein [Pedobacter sp. Hv1]KQC01160.1 hypothetical protein AQF98_10885 [Pedobacter sp. Hv1]
MKNNYTFSSRRKTYLKSTALFFLTFVSTMVFQQANAQSTYKIEGDSQIKVAVDSIKNNFTAVGSTNAINAEGNFIIKDGSLDHISSFKLKMPMVNSNMSPSETLTNDSIGFELTHVMVLPTMRLIHIVGMLDVGGVSSRTELDFSFTVNEDQTISLFGTKSIKLKDYNKDSKFSSAVLKDNAEVKLDMNLLFKNNQLNLAVVSPEPEKK